MSENILYLATLIIVSLSMFASTQLQAAPHPMDFERVEAMAHKGRGNVDKAYGFVSVSSDSRGVGSIEVMFSNGSGIEATFNARIKFLGSSGEVQREVVLGRHLQAADRLGATEGRVSRQLPGEDFASREVDFYLSNLPNGDTTTAALSTPGWTADIK